MPLRRQGLEEWFLDHQLRRVYRDHDFVQWQLSVDVTELWAAWKAHGRVPATSLVIKAVALLAEARPNANRMLFRTVFGTYVAEFPYVNINVPILMQGDGEQQLGAVIVRDAADKTVAEIGEVLKEAAARHPRSLPVGSLVFGKRNTWFNRLRLKLVHWAVYNLPWMYLKHGGGGLSVTSGLHRRAHGIAWWGAPLGPTGLTFGATEVRAVDGRQELHLGVGIDHGLLGGDEMADVLEAFAQVWQDPALRPS